MKMGMSLGFNLGGVLTMLVMFIAWAAVVMFLVACALALHYHVAGKTAEYDRAKDIAVKVLGLVVGLMLLVLIFTLQFR